jgi:hypothetical protein
MKLRFDFHAPDLASLAPGELKLYHEVNDLVKHAGHTQDDCD